MRDSAKVGMTAWPEEEVRMSGTSSWLKAGLIGAAASIVLQVMGIIPYLGCVTFVLVYVAYGCVGALATYWMPPRRLPAPAAGHGALAGAIAGVIGGTVGQILYLVITSVFGLSGDPQVCALLDPYALREMFDTVVVLLAFYAACQVLGVGIAAGLGALGGLTFASIQPE
jgi:hypothetical protein